MRQLEDPGQVLRCRAADFEFVDLVVVQLAFQASSHA